MLAVNNYRDVGDNDHYRHHYYSHNNDNGIWATNTSTGPGKKTLASGGGHCPPNHFTFRWTTTFGPWQ